MFKCWGEISRNRSRGAEEQRSLNHPDVLSNRGRVPPLLESELGVMNLVKGFKINQQARGSRSSLSLSLFLSAFLSLLFHLSARSSVRPSSSRVKADAHEEGARVFPGARCALEELVPTEDTGHTRTAHLSPTLTRVAAERFSPGLGRWRVQTSNRDAAQ